MEDKDVAQKENKMKKDTEKVEIKNNEKSDKKKSNQNTETKNDEKDYSLFTRVENSEKEQEKTIKEMEKKEKKEKVKEARSRGKIIAITVGIIIFVLLLISTAFSLTAITNQNMIRGVQISGIDVSGLSKIQAKGKIEEIYKEKIEKEIELKYQDYETTLNPTMLEVNYKIDDAVDEALKIGRRKNIFVSNYEILFTLFGGKNIDVDMELNEEVTKQSIEDIGISLPGIVEESTYYVEDDELIISKGKTGVVIDSEGLFNKVKDILKGIKIYKDKVEIPVIEKEPEPIDIEKIHDEICVEAQDAYIVKDPFAVYPEVEGISFDIEKAKEILAEEKDEYVIKLTITKPKITLSQIGSEAFPYKAGTFQTRYDISDRNRTQNLIIACQKLNGKVILPGETFSYNQTLGARTTEAGYRNGKIYSGGEVVDGIGGGICQISSTLYNAALLANLEIVERRNHQFVTSYVAAGRDATVVYGAIDFKFKNTRKYPIKITASASAGIATVSIYGIKEEEEYTFSFSQKVITTIPTQTKYEEDGTLLEGVEKVKQKGVNGQKIETYITKYLNGKIVSTKLLSRDTYDSMPQIIQRGTKKRTGIEQPSEPEVTPIPEITEEPKVEEPKVEEPEVERPEVEEPEGEQQPTEPETTGET